MEKAFALVDAAVDAGCDAFKIQVFNTEALISRVAEEWRQRMRSKQLSHQDITSIRDYCRERSILFFATGHDQVSVDFLHEMDIPFFKIGSGEVKNWPFMRYIGGLGRPVVLSTGMYTLHDVELAIESLKSGGCKEVVVLHCVTRYPATPDEINLKAMDTLAESFQIPVGYSDHTEGFHICLAAVARGACLIEKHISLDFNVPNAQDWKVSLDPDGLKEMVRQIREIEDSLGDGTKEIRPRERESISWARKSLVAVRDLEAGAVLTEELLIARRPGTGIAPSELGLVVGLPLVQPLSIDEPLTWSHLGKGEVRKEEKEP